MENPTFNKLMEVVLKSAEKDEKTLSNGVRLIRRTPQIAPDAWLHIVFPPLPQNIIFEMEKKLNILFPDSFKSFLMKANGVELFSSFATVWGKRLNFSRIGDDSWQPHDLVSHNRKNEIPINSPQNLIYFGTTNNGDDWCFFELKQGKQYRVGVTSRNKYEPIRFWNSLDEWLVFQLEVGEKRFKSNIYD